MRVISRFFILAWAVLFGWAFSLEIVWAQPRVVDVPHGVSVTTSMTLPVGDNTSPQHTYLKICTGGDFTPRFKIYPAGGAMFSALGPSTSPEPIWRSFEGEIFAIGDVLLSQDGDSATNVYTLHIFHYKDSGGALGTSSDRFLDTWLLEISHEDGQLRRFYFTKGHDPTPPEPVLLNVTVAPPVILLDRYGTILPSTIVFLIGYCDADGDLNGGTAFITDSQGKNYQGTVSNAEGIAGMLTTTIWLNWPMTFGELQFKIFVVDTKGNSSNPVLTTIEVAPYPTH